MAKTSTYRVELKKMLEPSCTYHFDLENDFFDLIDAQEVRKGKLSVDLKVKKQVGYFVLLFDIKGTIVIPCDRCLDDMDLPIETVDELKVKLGADFSEEGEVLIVPEDDGYINVAWYIYEFIALNIPIKHVHAPGQCNKGMISVLRNHLSTDGTDDENDFREDDDLPDDGLDDKGTDPRWDELKKILNNN